MAREATGELRTLANGYEARVRIDAGARKGFALTGIAAGDHAGATARCRAMAQIAARLRRAGHATDAEKILEMAAKARTARAWSAIEAAVDALCSGTTAEATSKAPSFVDFAKAWTSGELHKKWPDHVGKKKDTTDDERMVRLYVEPVIGDVGIDAFTLDHAEQIMAHLPGHLSSSSRRHVAQLVRRVLSLAVYPSRHRRETPIPKGWLPKVKTTTAFSCLYPDEDRALLACAPGEGTEGVPLVRRLAYGILAREGMRKGELASLRWRDLDLARGRVALDRNKTGDPRSWALDPGVARALAAWRKLHRPDAEPDEYVLGEAGARFYVEQLADSLRADLALAGVKRDALFERSDARRPLRVHDLRATFVTVSLAIGRTETWVADRTGHRSSLMINRYRRAARTWSELDLGALSPLDEALPELRLPQGLPHVALSEVPARGENLNDSEQRRGSDSNRRVADLQSAA